MLTSNNFSTLIHIACSLVGRGLVLDMYVFINNKYFDLTITEIYTPYNLHQNDSKM